jgi:hypothetical protein
MSRTAVSARIVLVGVLIAVVVAACGSSGSTILSKVGASVGGSEAGAPAASAAPSFAAGGSGSDGFTDGQGGSNAAPLVDDAKIIRTGTMLLQVTDLPTAVRSARDSVRAAGGYVSASRQSTNNDQPVASITYRIPSDRWEDALDAIRKLATKVIDEQTNSLEVTGQIVDLEARIANLRASETALQAISAKATKIPDILEVQGQLTNVRGQIEQLEGQRKHLNDQASYGTMTVTYGIEVKAVTEAAKGWNPGDDVDRATASLVGVLQALTSAGIWFAIVWIPMLLMLGLIAAIALFVLRRTGVLRRPEPPTTEPAA